MMKNAKQFLGKLFIAISMLLLGDLGLVQAQSGIYAGGPVYYGRSYSINELKNSGFTYVVVWTIHIDANGNFNFNGEFPLVQNGSYVGNTTYPNFPGDIASLKTGTTSIKRVEFGLSAWGSSTFANIRTLINSQGTGPNSNLYRNFQALKSAIPAIDAISFDDESTYDATSATALAVMLGNLGYKVTLCPYTAANFWTSVATNTNSQRPGTVDRVDLQCYAGGAGNNPCNWNFGNIPLSPGLWSKEKSTSQVQSQLTTWKNQCAIKGGFMWLYDDFDNSALVKQYATAINNVFSGDNGQTGMATFYKDINYGGYAVSLPAGSYTTAALQAKGILNNDITSLKVNNGYKVVLYDGDSFTGASITKTADDASLVDDGWNDRASSLVISANAASAFTTMIEAENYSSMSGVATESTTDAGGGTNVGWIETGDWMAFNSIAIPESGTYTIEYRVASGASGGTLSLDLNGGTTVLGTVTIPGTGDWQTWTTVSHTVTINAGTYNFGIYASTGGWNLNWFKITRQGAARLGQAESPERAMLVYPNPTSEKIQLPSSVDLSGGQLSIVDARGVEVVRSGLTSHVIDVTDLKPGIYTLQIIHTGRRSISRFVKQ